MAMDHYNCRNKACDRGSFTELPTGLVKDNALAFLSALRAKGYRPRMIVTGRR